MVDEKKSQAGNKSARGRWGGIMIVMVGSEIRSKLASIYGYKSNIITIMAALWLINLFASAKPDQPRFAIDG